ncbi:MAG: hypothetical protein Q4C96_04345 [Planctomycetia bacterium]|nr:hypothetical protein [Planctomycetia bacterium]
MTQYRLQYDWQRTSAVLATLLNCHSAGSGQIVPLDAFVPKFPTEESAQRTEEIITDPHEKQLVAQKLWNGR